MVNHRISGPPPSLGGTCKCEPSLSLLGGDVVGTRDYRAAAKIQLRGTRPREACYFSSFFSSGFVSAPAAAGAGGTSELTFVFDFAYWSKFVSRSTSPSTCSSAVPRNNSWLMTP